MLDEPSIAQLRAALACSVEENIRLRAALAEIRAENRRRIADLARIRESMNVRVARRGDIGGMRLHWPEFPTAAGIDGDPGLTP
jgi:hypothetical protein